MGVELINAQLCSLWHRFTKQVPEWRNSSFGLSS